MLPRKLARLKKAGGLGKKARGLGQTRCSRHGFEWIQMLLFAS